MGSSESKFAGMSAQNADIPFINTAIFAFNTMIKSSEYVSNFNLRWLGMNSPHVVILNNNNLQSGNNFTTRSRMNSNVDIIKPYRKSEDLPDKNELSRATSVAEFRFGDDCSQEEGVLLDRCWMLANQLTSANPVKAKLNVKTSQIDFNFEIENGNVSICIDGNDQTDINNEVASIENDNVDVNDICIENRLNAVKEGLDGLNDNVTVLDNFLENVIEQNKHNKTLSFGLDDETCVYYKSCSEPSDEEFASEEEDDEFESERKSRLDLLKDQLVSTLQRPEYIESGEGDVVEICAKIEEEISLSRRAHSIVSECSEHVEDLTGNN